MPRINALIGWLLVTAVFLIYLYGSYIAINLSWRSSGEELKIPEGLDATISSINALLLTNLGAVLGISVTNPTSAIARNILPVNKSLINREITPPMNSREQIQLTGIIIFLIVLIACMIVYIYKGWTSDPKWILAFVSQSAKMFIGITIAYITFILGAKQN